MAFTTINKSTDYFTTATWSGTGSQQTISLPFQADWIWVKRRNSSANHASQDIVNSFGYRLSPDRTVTLGSEPNGIGTVSGSGFNFQGDYAGSGYNESGGTYVSWNWKAGTSSGISGGTITPSAYSINTTSGFGIYKWSGTGSAGTIAHGLGAVPKMIIVKRLDSADTWWVYHSALGNNDAYLALNEQNAVSTSGGSGLWNSTAPTNQVFSVGVNTGVNGSGGTYVAYVFVEKTGYSKISSWTGNASANGAFAYCGFKPRWLLLKNTAITSSWVLVDSGRDTANSVSKALFPDANSAEYDYTDLFDFVSNGIKVRNNGNAWSGSGQSIAFMAFGQPLVGTNNIPATAF